MAQYSTTKPKSGHRETLFGVLQRFTARIFFSGDKNSSSISAAFSDLAHCLPDAVQNTGHDLIQWASNGSLFRALILISVGIITLLALTGSLLFTFFFLAATINAILICLVISLALFGGFLAFFFSCVTAVYIGALSIAVFVVSTVTISIITALLILTGWLGFFWGVWLATKKTLGIAKQTFGLTYSSPSAYSVFSIEQKNSFSEVQQEKPNPQRFETT